MRLELENAPSVKNPDANAIRTSLASVQGFAVLSRDKMTYIQSSGCAEDGFVLEYQEGDTDSHYRCPDALSLERVTEAFLSYAKGTDYWRTAYPWQQQDI